MHLQTPAPIVPRIVQREPSQFGKMGVARIRDTCPAAVGGANQNAPRGARLDPGAARGACGDATQLFGGLGDGTPESIRSHAGKSGECVRRCCLGAIGGRPKGANCSEIERVRPEEVFLGSKYP